MNRNSFFKVCTMLLALLLVLACGGSGKNTSDAAPETSAQQAGTGKTSSKAAAKQKKKAAKVKKKKSLLTPASAGAPYEILVVSGDDAMHNGSVDTLYSILTDDVPGIAQSEPQFKVVRINVKDFSSTFRLCRNIIKVNIDPGRYSSCKMKYSRDQYAEPQLVLTIQAPSAFKFIEFVKDNADEIVEFFNRAELNRQCDLLKENPQPRIQEEVKKRFGCDIWAPIELDRIKIGRNFVWARSERFVRNVEQKLNLVVYSYPYRDVRTFTQDYFVRKRDSVMKANIPGPREDQYMMTTMPFVFVSDETVHGEYAQVVRGLWNVKGYDMGGPFVSVSRVDEKYQRVIVAEAFVYYPNQAKRNVLKRLEAALYTLRLPDELDEERYRYDLDEITIEPED